MILPVLVAENQHGSRAVSFIARDKGSAKQGPDAQDIEEVGRDHRGFDALGAILADQQEVHGVMLHDSLKRVVLFAIIGDFLNRKRHV